MATINNKLIRKQIRSASNV